MVAVQGSSLARVQGKELNGYLTIEEPFKTGGKEDIFIKIHEDGTW